jgi:hypothetical protein
MRIIAKNHDYYDTVLAHGHDEHVVYVREEISYRGGYHPRRGSDGMPDKFKFMRPTSSSAEREGKHHDFRFSPFMVAFCGKLHAGIAVEKTSRRSLNSSHAFFYDFETYQNFCAEHEVPLLAEKESRFRMRGRWLYASHRYSSRLHFEKGAKAYFEDWEKKSDRHFDFFVEEKIPVAVCHSLDADQYFRLEINCELKRFEFFKVFDPFTAFQELDMFIAGTMVGDEAAMARIDDERMMKKKGFDHPYSFRKEPTKKR